MDRAAALDALPPAHADVLRWRDGGLGNAAIAARLEIEPKGVPLLIRVAEAKLAALMARSAAPPARRSAAHGRHAGFEVSRLDATADADLSTERRSR